MALKRGIEVPANAVRLSEDEVVSFQWDQILGWPTTSDVWPWTRGFFALTGISSVSALVIGNKYRTKLRLHNFGRAISTGVLFVAPAVFSGMLHIKYVTNPLFEMNNDCKPCWEMKSGFVQFLTGCVFPTIFAPITTYTMASVHGTIRIPYIKDRVGLWNFYVKMTKPMLRSFAIVGGVNFLAGVAFAHLEDVYITRFREKLAKMEEEGEEIYYNKFISHGESEYRNVKLVMPV